MGHARLRPVRVGGQAKQQDALWDGKLACDGFRSGAFGHRHTD
jgi:hypothetical protein